MTRADLKYRYDGMNDCRAVALLSGGMKICTGVGEDFVKQPLLTDLVEKDVETANEQLEGFERIRKYTILQSRFTEENGQLTPTQKTKKNVILKDYEEIINNMY